MLLLSALSYNAPTALHLSGTDLFGAVGIHLDSRPVVENHGRHVIWGKCRPMRQPRMIRIPRPCELDPCIAHGRREGSGFGAAARHGFAAVRVVEYEGDLRAMKRARAPA